MTDFPIQELFKKYLDETITPGELQRLYEMIGKEGALLRLDPLLESAFSDGNYAAPADVAQRQEILSNLLDRIGASKHQIPVIGNRRSWMNYAAAAVVIIISGAALLLYKAHTARTAPSIARQTPVRDIPAPVGAKAMLTLAGGERIILDSAVNGQLAMQGNTQIRKLTNGQLAYETGNTHPDEMLYNTLSTTKGGQTMVVLSDGTKVWLNALSSLRYPTAFGKERQVQLDGEAYFEVSGDKSRPFKVNVRDKGEVLVLGTHFNINTYNDEPTINTTLLEGSVKVSNATTAPVTIRPGQQAQLSDSRLTVRNNVNTEEVMAWKNGYFSFDEASTEEIMRQASRWYDVKVVYEGNTKDERFSGSLPRSANASRLLEVLSLTKTVQFVIEDKTIIVKPFTP